MGKIYFAFQILLNNCKSIFIKILYKLFGMKIGKNTIFAYKIFIRGYINKIKIGEKCYFDKNIKITINKEGEFVIENNTLLSNNININAGKGSIYIGSNVMIASNTYIINNDHNIYEDLSIRKSGHLTEDIVIEDNVWIGANCVILKGVIIGEGAIIGAGSVVTKDIKPYSINYGIPCIYKKDRFSDEELVLKLRYNRYSDREIENILHKRRII